MGTWTDLATSYLSTNSWSAIGRQWAVKITNFLVLQQMTEERSAYFKEVNWKKKKVSLDKLQDFCL